MWAILVLVVISFAGCGKPGNKVTVTKTPDGKTTTTVTSSDERILSSSSK
jgi:hypothetical protein